MSNKCEDKKVLDLGCGYLSILGLIAMHYGAQSITSVDFDNKCLEWLTYIVKQNKIQNINIIQSDFFSNVEVNEKYDLILSNPPHMPMVVGRLCDSGGIDSKKCIKQILVESYSHLSENGELYIMMFDFLGIDKAYNNDCTLSEYAKKIGYSNIETVYEIIKNINKGSITFECLDYIKQIYPNYNFGTSPACKIVIVKFTK